MKLTANFALGAVLAAILPLSPIYAQDGTPPSVAEAPPMGASEAPAVYNWHDVPANTPVVITRAVFDQGGYQLYCQTGETIVVPFENQNLYVMRFGRSEDGATHFVNDGVAPTLLVPQGGYLENAAAQGARWFPFPANYVYTGPVYMGVAPTYSEYVNMGWYPGMVYYGGYWGYHPYAVGVRYEPLPGLYFSIYDHPYYGWSSYHNYYYAHPEHRYYEKSVVVYHYDSYKPRGVAYYHEHPEHSFAVEHRAAVLHHTEQHIADHRAAAMLPGNDHHSAGAFGGAHPTGGSFGGAHPAPNTFGGAHTSDSSFGRSTQTHTEFGGAHPAGGAFGGSHPTTTPFGGGHPTTPGSTAFGGSHPTPSGSFGGTHAGSPTPGSFGGTHPGGTTQGSFGGSHSPTATPGSSGGSHPGGSFGSGGGHSSFPSGGHTPSGSKPSSDKSTPAPPKKSN